MQPAQWAGVSAILAAATLLAGIAGLVTHRPGGCPWLVLLCGINAGYGDVTPDSLRAAPPIDVLLLLLATVTCAGFWPGPGGSHVWWMALALAQPLLGIAVLLATRLWGRSGLMGGALVLSILMLLDGTWRVAGWLGTTASVLLLVGDVATTARPRRLLAAILTAGYAMLSLWFGWVAAVLLT
jgi:hypothetical protein